MHRPFFSIFRQTCSHCRLYKASRYRVFKIIIDNFKFSVFLKFMLFFITDTRGKTLYKIRRRGQTDYAFHPFGKSHGRIQCQPTAHRSSDYNKITGNKLFNHLTNLISPNIKISFFKICRIASMPCVIKTQKAHSKLIANFFNSVGFASPSI